MKTPFTLLALLMATTLALADDNADQGHVANKLKLTLAGAKKVGEADAKFAKNSGAGPSIAVVDYGGYLLYFVRPEESFAAGANVSIGKARTSAIFKKPISRRCRAACRLSTTARSSARLVAVERRARSRTKKSPKRARQCLSQRKTNSGVPEGTSIRFCQGGARMLAPHLFIVFRFD